MVSALSSMTFTRQIAAPPAEVYRAFTNSVALKEWFSDGAYVEAQQGGAIYVWWHGGYLTRGSYTRLDPSKHVAFTWDGTGEPEPTAVSVVLEGKGSGTYVTLTHEKLSSGAEWEKIREEVYKGWTVGLENLQSVLETGDDLRFTRRPMLGIVGGDEITPEKAAELGIPVSTGVRLDGTVDGMGARAAGLDKDDVLVGMGGKPVTSWQSLIATLNNYQAGDQVEIVFYRGTERMSATMDLSKRPLPSVPTDPRTLAEMLQKLYEKSNIELEKALDGVSDTKASHHPAQDEWSVKEVLAHLISLERDTQRWIASLLSDHEDSVFADNVDVRLKAMVAVFGSVPALVDEFKRAQAETTAMIATLPSEFAARKGGYVKVGRTVLEDFHVLEHVKQIRAAVQSAG